MTLSAYHSSLQRKAAVESVAMRSRHDPRIVAANMKALSYRVGGLCGTVRASERGCP